MYKEIAKLIMYGNMKEDTILVKLGEIFRAFDEKTEDNAQLIRDIYTQLKRLLRWQRITALTIICGTTI